MDPQRFRVRPNGLSTNGGATTADGSTYTAPSVTLTLPTHLGAAPFQRMITWRHVAMVFDATPDSIRGYLCVHEKHVTLLLPFRGCCHFARDGDSDDRIASCSECSRAAAPLPFMREFR